MEPDSDITLIERIREQDQGACRQLFERYYPRVFAFVQRRIQDSSLSEEVVADVFFEVWRSAQAFRGASRVSTWIFGIATFKCMEADRNRRRHKRSAVIPTNLEILHRVPDEQDADGIVEARSELRWIKTRLDALPEGQREVAELALLDGQSTEEIADRLGISKGTVKSRLSRARRDLRQFAESARREVSS